MAFTDLSRLASCCSQVVVLRCYHGDPDLASWTSSQLSHMRPSCPLSESSDSLLPAEAIIPSFFLEVLIAVNNHHVLGILHTISFISQEVRGSTVSHYG